jgi:hypothetical protein
MLASEVGNCNEAGVQNAGKPTCNVHDAFV